MNTQPPIDAHEISEMLVESCESGQSSATGSGVGRWRHQSLAGLDPTIPSEFNAPVRVGVLTLSAFFAIAALVFGWLVASAVKSEAVADDVAPATAPQAVIQESALPLPPNPAGDALEGSLFAARRLTNRDIVNLTRSQVSSQYIVALIHRLGDGFKVDARATAELRKAGVAEDVILAMVDSTVAADISAALAKAVAQAGLGHRDNFQAADEVALTRKP